MSNVTIEIGGRRYTVACGEGEEGHIAMLGQTIDGKISGQAGLGAQSEARTLLYAALLLADELSELRGRSAPEPAGSAEALEMLAEKLESVASQLESAGASA